MQRPVVSEKYRRRPGAREAIIKILRVLRLNRVAARLYYRYFHAAVGPPAALSGEWVVTLSARPNYFGRYTRFGQVVQNLQGVAANVLPIDRVVSVRIYEGNGREPLPPLN